MRNKIKTFTQLTGFDAAADQTVDDFVARFRAGFEGTFQENLPEKALQALDFAKTAMQSRKAELHEAVVDIYAELFSEEEIDELVAFYQRPVGVKLTQIGGHIQTRAQQASAEWTAKALQEVNAELTQLLLGQDVNATSEGVPTALLNTETTAPTPLPAEAASPAQDAEQAPAT